MDEVEYKDSDLCVVSQELRMLVNRRQDVIPAVASEYTATRQLRPRTAPLLMTRLPISARVSQKVLF